MCCQAIFFSWASEGSSCNTNQSDSEIYIVKEGDSLSAIAAKYRTTYQKIAEDNGIMQPYQKDGGRSRDEILLGRRDRIA